MAQKVKIVYSYIYDIRVENGGKQKKNGQDIQGSRCQVRKYSRDSKQYKIFTFFFYLSPFYCSVLLFAVYVFPLQFSPIKKHHNLVNWLLLRWPIGMLMGLIIIYGTCKDLLKLQKQASLALRFLYLHSTLFNQNIYAEIN